MIEPGAPAGPLPPGRLAGEPGVAGQLETATLGSLVIGVYLPVLAAQTGAGMLVPTLPLWLRELGADYTTVSVVLAAVGLGALVASLPVGRALERFDDDVVLVFALVAMAISMLVLALTEATPVLAGAQAVTGAGGAALILSRQNDIGTRIAAATRGRAMSGLGTVLRASVLIGPVLGGALVAPFGFEGVFMAAGAVVAAGIVPVLVARRRRPPAPVLAVAVDVAAVSTIEVLRAEWRSIAGAGGAQLASMAIRFGRQTLFPLWGAAVGLDAAEVGLVISLSAALDLVLSPLAGVLMDRCGRLWAIVPSFSLMAVGMMALPVLGGLGGLIVAGVLVGIGNGIGAGTMLTVGADLAPPAAPGRFLAALAVVRDSGRIAGPLVVGVAADALGLGWSAAALAVAGAATVVIFVVVVGETGPAARPGHGSGAHGQTEGQGQPAQQLRTSGRAEHPDELGGVGPAEHAPHRPDGGQDADQPEQRRRTVERHDDHGRRRQPDQSRVGLPGPPVADPHGEGALGGPGVGG